MSADGKTKSVTTETSVSGDCSVTSNVEKHDVDGYRAEVAGDERADRNESSENAQFIPRENSPLSKNQMKKLKKKERWLQVKAEKRHAEKQKRKRRFAEMRERGEDIGPSRKSLKKKRMLDSQCRQRVAIDCSFDSFMTEKDTTFLVQQIQHSYAANRRADNPLQLYMCGVGGKAKERLDSIGDYKGWDMHKEERDFTDVFTKEEIVYLSSESPNVLNTLDDSKVYVIGGLVDHNHHKGLCHKLAEDRGLAHAQLPIAEFLQLKSRKVLTINHVFEILLRFTETKDWQASLLTVLPQRKGACPKAGHSEADPDSDHNRNVRCHDSSDKNGVDKSSEVPKSVMNGSKMVSASVQGSGDGSECVENSETGNMEDNGNAQKDGENEGSCVSGRTKCSSSDGSTSEGDVRKTVTDTSDV